MAPESSRGRGVARGGRGAPKKAVAPKGKGRRNEEERKQMIQQERERNKERDAAYAAQLNAERIAAEREEREKQRAAGRGRGRGRGGYMGQNVAAAGIFSLGSNIGDHVQAGRAFPRPWAPSDSKSRGAGSSAPQFSHIHSGGSGGVKYEGGSSGVSVKKENAPNFERNASSNVKRMVEDGGYISSDVDEEEHGPRFDVDYINQYDLTAEDRGTGTDTGEGAPSTSRTTRRFNSPAQAPIRINRNEHRDRAPHVNPEGSENRAKPQPTNEDDDDAMELDPPAPSVKKGKQKAGDVELVGSSRRWRGVYEDEHDFVHVKEEPDDNAIEPPTSIGKSARRKSEESKPRRHHRASFKTPPAHLQTAEEKAEFFRHEIDLGLLIDELSNIGPTPETTAAEAGTSTAETARDQKEDRVYLFQLPPVVPNLFIPTPITIKDEPREGPQTEEQSTAANNDQAQPNSTTDATNPPIKIEDDSKSTGAKKPKHLPELTSGLAGKLRVHRSGKVTLNWGGTSLQVNKGMDSNFLQDIVLVRKGAEGGGGAGIGGASSSRNEEEGDALAFGQLRGKFVVTPDWDEVLG
ncbi:hypothetical protein EJ08DRAFT_652050 [Tothia fuscella]|uniref:DNA-directed RNA polymerase III subunit RPC4 n=1 Tax=Tothia fuscella TaxID=1048955 RepID=A0A9P4NKY8_9PEZI|nr:hypothetical protein EJ08DRAFT_652050 [Tothia fuscella]